jgi:transcriptional regulator with XRE-family HTH domain
MTRKAGVGSRIKKYRQDRGMTASQLAAKSGVSKSYISELESDSGTGKHPSADKLYAIAKALGVAMSDLLGRPIITDPVSKHPPSLLAFAKQAKLPQADVEMLARIQFRGEPPKTQERWEFIYQAIRNSTAMDD